MSGYPGTSDALQTVFMDADGSHSLTAIAIPSGQVVALLTAGQPSIWQNIAKGAYPINAPAAPSLGSPNGYSGYGGMTANQQYQYTLTDVTDYGETLESTVLTVTAVQMGTNTSVRLNLPADAESTTDVKVRARRLYRTAAGGSTRGFVAQINDMGLTHYIDGLADTGLGDAPPSSNTSGTTGAVTVVSTDGAYGSWTEQPYGATLTGGQFSVDYGFDANGGTVHFAAVDVGKHVTITFTASIALTSSFFNSIIQAIKDIRGAIGIPGSSSGVALLDVNSHVAEPPATGVRQHLGRTYEDAGAFDVPTINTGSATTSISPVYSLTISAGGSIVVRAAATFTNTGTTDTGFFTLYALINGPGMTNAFFTIGRSGTTIHNDTGHVSGPRTITGLTPGTYTVKLVALAGNDTFSFYVGNGDNHWSIEIEEIGGAL